MLGWIPKLFDPHYAEENAVNRTEWRSALQRYIVEGTEPPVERFDMASPEMFVGRMFKAADNPDELAAEALLVFAELDEEDNVEAITRWLELAIIAPHSSYATPVHDFFYSSCGFSTRRDLGLDLQALRTLQEIQGTLDDTAEMKELWESFIDIPRFRWGAINGLRRLNVSLTIPHIARMFGWPEVDTATRAGFLREIVRQLRAKQVDPFTALHGALADAFSGLSEAEIRRHFTDIGLADDVDKLLAT